MANKQHLKIIDQGVEAWNDWRRRTPEIRPDLRGADLERKDLKGANLREADLVGANLSDEANLRDANLSGANLCEADLSVTVLEGANLSGANLYRANIFYTYFSGANLSGANLWETHLNRADLNGADLSGADLKGSRLDGIELRDADLSESQVGGTTFEDVDLSSVKGLEAVIHHGPSTIGVDTLYWSQGHIPEAFLRGAGVPEEFITQIPALIASVSPIQFQSCFISYSHRDEEFAKRLHSAMRGENLRVWFAPEEMKGGKKLHEQIYQAIEVHDRLLLVLSTESMKSEWVMTEIRRAKTVERAEDRRKLFPIRLVDFETIQSWECFDADSSKDLATEVREYYIPDFSNWKDHDAFELEFAKLLTALRATEK
jgi:TIR domain/Pentapeptide repeats (8 copies)